MSTAKPVLIPELNAEATEAALKAEPVSATRSYPITVGLYEAFGRAYITWGLDPNYAIGPDDVVQLREGSTVVKNWKVTGPTGSYDTGHVWGSGLNGSYWAMNYQPNGWKQLVVTPDTKG